MSYPSTAGYYSGSLAAGSAIETTPKGTPMKPVQCWEGAYGNLKRSEAEAAADIIGAANMADANYLIGGDNPMPEKSRILGEAILWVAAKIKNRKGARFTNKSKKAKSAKAKRGS